MSVRDAAGCALPRSQSVSVVPMIQCRPHGMTNSTLVSVRRISPVADWMRSRGTTRWMPLDARTWNWPRSPDHRLGHVGPHAGGVDDLPGPDLDLGVGLEVAHPHPGDPLALAQEADHSRPVGHQRAVGRGGAYDGGGVPGVVDLRVVVLDGADQRVLAQRRRLPQRRGPGQVPVARQAAGVAGRDAEGVVERDAGAGVQPLPAAVLERVEERHRAHQVRREALGQQAALAQRLPDQAEVEHLQVAQPAVHQLAGPAGRAGRPVPALEQADGQPAGRGVQRHAGTDDAAADHDDIELVELRRVQGGLPFGGPQSAGGGGRLADGRARVVPHLDPHCSPTAHRRTGG